MQSKNLIRIGFVAMLVIIALISIDIKSAEKQRLDRSFEEEAENYVRQFKELTDNVQLGDYVLKTSPKDSRFTFGEKNSNTDIAQELWGRDANERDSYFRFYGFKNPKNNILLTIVREAKSSKLTSCDYSYNDKYTYLDIDADGLWDVFIDRSDKEVKYYERDGLSWKQTSTPNLKNANFQN